LVVEIERLGRETDGRLGSVTGGMLGGAGASLTGSTGGVGGVGELVMGGPVGAAVTGSRVLLVAAVGVFGVLAFGLLDTGLLRGVRTGMRTVPWVR